MEGVADAVGGAVIVTVTVCAATAATKSIIAVETADRACGAILKDQIRKQASWRVVVEGDGSQRNAVIYRLQDDYRRGKRQLSGLDVRC
jgi:hypothetical protein